MTDRDMRVARDQWLATPTPASCAEAFEAGWYARTQPRGEWDEVYSRGLFLLLRHRRSGQLWLQIRASTDLMGGDQNLLSRFDVTLDPDEARWLAEALIDAAPAQNPDQGEVTP